MLSWWRPNTLQRTVGAAIGLLLGLARIPPTPARRIYPVAPESRIYQVEAERRIYPIPAEDSR